MKNCNSRKEIEHDPHWAFDGNRHRGRQGKSSTRQGCVNGWWNGGQGPYKGRKSTKSHK